MNKPKKFYTIKQEPESCMCMACVAAMVVGRKTIDWGITISKVNGEDFVKTCHLLEYIGKCGVVHGLTFGVYDSEAITPDAEIDCGTLTLKGHVAILTVKSENFEDANHAVLWDGEHVRDPSPYKPDTTELSDYTILEIAPLTYLTGEYE